MMVKTLSAEYMLE